MQTSIQLASNNRPSADQLASTNGGEFNRGIFQIVIPPLSLEEGSLQPAKKMRFIMYVSVDASGSMGETASKKGQPVQSKMEFVHITLTNMIEYIASQEEENPQAEFYIAIVSFDSFASCPLLPCRVTRENKDQLIQTVKSITPRGGTNFEKCFQEIARLLGAENDYIKHDEAIQEEFVQRMHIFLTDGANNEGEKNVQRLASLLTPPTLTVPRKPATQIMIGYGADHDSTMLQRLCALFPKSKQWFIDDAEKTGCIFGEILWSAINTVYSQVKLSTNVEFFDFTSMSWKSEMDIDDLIIDSSRTFYIRVPWDVDTLVCGMTYFSTESGSNATHTTQKSITYAADQENALNENVVQELWRLDTITTVGEALTFLQNIRRMPYNASVEEKERLLGVVTTFQEKFLAYVAEKELSDDPFMIQLADDLFVCISGLMAASIGERYVAARQASQIQQRSVTVNDITPLQTEILSSMPFASPVYTNPNEDDESDDCVPAAPRRAYSNGGFVGNNDTTPRTPPPTNTTRIVEDDQLSEEQRKQQEDQRKQQEEQRNKEDDKLVSELTPSSRGVGSRLRHLSRDAIVGMRRQRTMRYGGDNYEDEGEYYSCGGADDTYSSHASPGCARIGRMFSAPSQTSSAPNRTYTTPF
jgi:hypothetical protein